MDPDTKELLDEVERAFGVRFANGELTDDSTLDDLYQMLLLRCPAKSSEVCFTSIAFWRLRRSATALCNLPKRSITPATPLELVLPRNGRRHAWASIANSAALRLPGLEYSSMMSAFIVWSSILVSAIVPIAVGGGWWFGLGVVLLPLSSAFLCNSCKRFADTLPSHTQTFGDLAKVVVGLNYALFATEFGTSRDSEIMQALRYLISDLIDIDPRILTRENPRLLDLALANDGFRATV